LRDAKDKDEIKKKIKSFEDRKEKLSSHIVDEKKKLDEEK